MHRRAQRPHVTGSLAYPAGLDRMRPREVQPTAAGWSMLVLAAALVAGTLAAGVGLEVKALRDRDEILSFREHARGETAVVTRKWRKSDEDRTRWIAYQYTIDGRTFGGETRPSRSTWETLEPGSTFPLRVDPARPERAYTWGREPEAVPPAVPFLVGAAGLVGGALLTIPFFRQRRLLTEGRAALATVTSRTKGEHGETIHYKFHVLSGSEMKGQTGPTGKPPAVGSTLWVVYASDHPQWNRPYPLPFVRLAREAPLSRSSNR